MVTSDVIVLGAGPAGLMASYRAAESGLSCVVLEAADHVGGMAGSFEVAGQRVDYGSHRLHPATPTELLDVIRRLVGDDLQTRQRAGRLHLAGQWVGFPLRAAELARALPPTLTTKMIRDAGLASLMGRYRSNRATSFDDEVRARFGPTVAEEFYGPYAAKLYGLDPTELDRELARRRISATSPLNIARRLVKARTPSGRVFLYPRRGYGQIVERLADAAVEAGVELNLSTPVSSVSVGHDQVTVRTGNGGTLTSGSAFSSLPLTRLAAMLHPAPPAAVATAVDQLRTRAMLLVYLVVDRPHYTSFDAHYVPGLDTRVARVSEPKNYRDGDDPPDRTVLCAEIPCWTTDDLWTWSAEDLSRLVVDDLVRIGLPDATPLEVDVRRLRSVYPVYDLAGIAARSVVDEWTRTTGRLLMFGRQGLRVIDNLHHVFAMGSAATASRAEDGRILAAAWARHLDAFANNTVED